MSRSVTLEVRDDGVGMDEATLARVFAGERHADSDGGGIGLTNIGERLDSLFGDRYDLDVRSAPGKGTRVTLQVPLP